MFHGHWLKSHDCNDFAQAVRQAGHVDKWRMAGYLTPLPYFQQDTSNLTHSPSDDESRNRRAVAPQRLEEQRMVCLISATPLPVVTVQRAGPKVDRLYTGSTNPSSDHDGGHYRNGSFYSVMGNHPPRASVRLNSDDSPPVVFHTLNFTVSGFAPLWR
jgi:hypothetical protein